MDKKQIINEEISKAEKDAFLLSIQLKFWTNIVSVEKGTTNEQSLMNVTGQKNFIDRYLKFLKEGQKELIQN